MLVLTAKTSAKDLRPGEISLFPTEMTGAHAFSQEELLGLSDLYSKIYRQYINNISTQLSAHYNIKRSVVDILVREALVPIIHFFIDRLLRLDNLLKSQKEAELSVLATEPFDAPMNIEQFKLNSGTSYTFNQSMLCRLSGIYDLQITKENGSGDREGGIGSKYKYMNYNYDQSYLTKIRRLIFLGSSRLLALINPSFEGKIPVLGMSYATPFLQEKGFYRHSSFVFVGGRVIFGCNTPDQDLRKKVLIPALNLSASPLCDFLKCVGYNNLENCRRVTKVIEQYILEYYPSTMFEDIPSNIGKCVQYLKRYKGKSIILTNAGALESTYFLAAARSLGMKIIEYQEGGHEGYEDDYVQSLDAEYNYIDGFISWGWKSLPYERLENKVNVKSLPSPWLSARRKYWKKLCFGRSRNRSKVKYDFLFMPNKMWPYPPAPSGANISRIDHIHSFTSIMKEFIKKAANNGFSVLHKPFNQATIALLQYTMEELENLGGEHYHCDYNLSKGLRHELVDQCRMILWDQPGTGFLECLTSGLPTMILWPRIYNQEVPAARSIFSELEEVGICHRSVDSLLSEYGNFTASPQEWMSKSDRVNVVTRFCREYAWTEEDWPKYWWEYIKSLG